MMAERPILFSGPMVKAIFAGRKTQTRRIISIPEIVRSEDGDGGLTTIEWVANHESGPGWYGWMSEYPDEGSANIQCPYGVVGDRLWVREACWIWGRWVRNGLRRSGKPKWLFKASNSELVTFDKPGARIIKMGDERTGWMRRPGMFMPRWACRTVLDITEIRVQRLQEISEEDAKAEGIERINDHAHWAWKDYLGYGQCLSPIFSFDSLWESINGPGSWGANPWVWAITFTRGTV